MASAFADFFEVSPFRYALVPSSAVLKLDFRKSTYQYSFLNVMFLLLHTFDIRMTFALCLEVKTS